MSAATAPMPRPSLGRLTLVELRKTFDTRAGFWLRNLIGLLMVAIVVIVGIVGDDADHALSGLLPAAAAPALFLLPVVGILLVTSEWSQRTTLITFTIVPRRLDVVAAKLLAGLMRTAIALVVALVLAVIGTAVSGGEWTLSAAFVGQVGLYLAIVMVMGIAFGAVIQASAPAIVIYFVLPTALGALGSLKALEGASRWLDTGDALGPLTEHLLSGTEWARAATSVAFWVLLPLAVGAWRIAREDIQ